MSTLRLRFASTNAPESMKRGLLKDRLARARRVLAFYVRRRVDVGALQESGTYARKVATKSPVKAVYAAFNDFVNGRQIGNGAYVNRLRFKAKRLEDITIGTGSDAIHIAVVKVTHRRTGFTFTFRAVHKPTKRATNKALRPVVDAALTNACRIDDAAGRAWVVAGDMNGTLSIRGGVNLGSSGPDHIIGSRHFEALGQKVVDRPLLSDHEFLIADAAVEV